MSARWRRTVLTALVAGLAARALLLPLLEAVGRVLMVPPVYTPVARGFAALLWLTLVAAAWAYRPAAQRPGSADLDQGGGSGGA